MSFFRLLGYKIYYLTIDNHLKNYNLIKFIENYQYYWLSYEVFDEEKRNYQNKLIAKKKAFKIAKKISLKLWNKNIKKILKKNIFLSLCVYERILNKILLLEELSNQLKVISRKNNNLVWIDIFEFYNVYSDFNKNTKNICPLIYIFSLAMFKFLFQYLKLVLDKFLFLFKKKIKTKSKKINYQNYKYAFLPKGIIEGNHPKDFFLSSNRNNDLNFEKLFVIEVNKNELKRKYTKYLNKKKINYCLWQEVNFFISNIKKKEILRIFFKTLLSTKNFSISFLIYKILILNEKNLSNLSRLKNLKFLILGHEELIPIN